MRVYKDDNHGRGSWELPYVIRECGVSSDFVAALKDSVLADQIVNILNAAADGVAPPEAPRSKEPFVA